MRSKTTPAPSINNRAAPPRRSWREFGAIAPFAMMCCSLFSSATAIEEPAAAPLDIESAELLRCWMRGAELPLTPFRGDDPSPSALTVDHWRRFIIVMATQDGAQRERSLQQLHQQIDSPLLRSRILEAIARDPDVQSRQAEFVRRYGFYATGFNRVFYSLGQIIQGKLQAGAQLAVDGVYAVTAPGAADARTRLAYDKLERAVANKPTASAEERDRLRSLKQRVDRALADADLDRATWALQTGHPDAAAFYAAQAEITRPDWGAARRMRERAEAEAARVRREAVASRQVGFPDRQPPIGMADPDLLRDLLLDERLPPASGDKTSMIFAFLRILREDRPGVDARGRAALMRLWAELPARHPRAPESQLRWLEATLASPRSNPDMRLEQAQWRRRGRWLRFVFLGPESPRRQAYKAASWTAQSFQALQSVGVFYVFEVMARAVLSVWTPPIPESESLDARAAWLRQEKRPLDARGLAIARGLASDYRKGGRFDDARATLDAGDILTAERRRALNREQARRLAEMAEQATDEGTRAALLDSARTLDPDVAAKARAPRPVKPVPRAWSLSWDALQRWSKSPLPCGLPGSAVWFDGELANGEIAQEPVRLEETDATIPGDGPLLLTYTVLAGGERRLFQEPVALETLAPALREWMEVSARQDAAARESLDRLDRLPIPFSIEGGAGVTGVDFYPELKSLNDPSVPLELYE